MGKIAKGEHAISSPLTNEECVPYRPSQKYRDFFKIVLGFLLHLGER